MKKLDYYKSLEYDVTIRKEKEGGETWYVAYCDEFGVNACHGIGQTMTEALQSYQEEKDIFIEFLYEKGETIPEPIQRNDGFSGVFSVRTSPWVHSLIAAQANRNGVSINTYMNQIMCYAAGQESIKDEFKMLSSQLSARISEQLNSIQYGSMRVGKEEKDQTITYKISA